MNITLPIPSLSLPYLRDLNKALQRILLTLNNQSKRHEGTAAPTTGKWAQGNIVWNTIPSELGTGGSKYVVIGWICVFGGESGTWQEMRTLTGN